MLRNLLRMSIASALCLSGTLVSKEIEYEIQDIGTLQAHSSKAISINSAGQILGWFNVDGTSNGKHSFIRDVNGEFHEIEKFNGWDIEWKYLSNSGKAYGVYSTNFLMWDSQKGVTNLGTLPSTEVAAINDAGQVLIKSMVGKDSSGKQIRYPAIWQNGVTTKLQGLEGDLGTESVESYGFDMNNRGEVVGKSLVELVYKNKVYTQVRPVKWSKGQVIDLYQTIPKSDPSAAIAINDLGDILIESNDAIYMTGLGMDFKELSGDYRHINNLSYAYSDYHAIDKENKTILNMYSLSEKITNDYDSIWMKAMTINMINAQGEAIAEGMTIYHENHAMLLVPKKVSAPAPK